MNYQNTDLSLWENNLSEDLKNELKDFSKKKKKELFLEKLVFLNNKFEFKINKFGVNNLNIFTFSKFLKAIESYLLSKNLKKNILVTFSNKISEKDFFIIESLLKTKETIVNSTSDYLGSVGLSSNVLNKSDFSLGIHIENNLNLIRINLLNLNGDNLDKTELNEIYEIYKNLKIDFKINELEQKKPIKLINNGFFEKYISVLENEFIDLKFVNQINKEKILINCNSDFNYKLLKEIYSKKENLKNVKLINKKNDEDIKNVKSFHFAYKYANKHKIKHIINLSQNGDRFSFASKKSGIWKFFKSTEIFLLLINYVSNEKKDKEIFSINLNKEHSDFLKDICKQNTIKLDKNYNLDTNENYDIFIKNSFNNVFDSLFSHKFLIKIVFNNDSIINILNTIFKKSGFFYSKHKDFINEIDYKNLFTKINTNDLIETSLKIKSYKIIEDNLNFINFVVKTHQGDVNVLFNKQTNFVQSYTYSYSKDKDEAFYNNRVVQKEILKILENNQKQNFLDTKKGQIRLLGLFALFIIMTLIIFFTLFGAKELSNSFAYLFNGINTPWIYILLSNLFLFPIFKSGILFVIIKKMHKETKFSHIYLSFVISSFVRMISPSYILGTGAQIWYLRKVGFHSSELVPSFLIYSIAFGLFNLFINLFILTWASIILRSGILNLQFDYYVLFMWIGFIWMSFSLFWITLISFSKTIHDLIFLFVEKTLFFIKREDKYTTINDELDFNAIKIRRNFTYFKKQKASFLIIFGFVIGGLIYTNVIVYSSFNIVIAQEGGFEFRSYYFRIYDIFDFILINSVATFANIISPIPGSSGTTELALIDLYSAYLEASDIAFLTDFTDEIVFIERIFTYYGLVLFSAIPTYITFIYFYKNKTT